MKTILKRISVMLLVVVMIFPAVHITADADVVTAEEGYESTDEYVLDYDGSYSGAVYQYLARWKPYAYWTVKGEQKSGTRTGCVFSLYDIQNDIAIPAFCMDCGVSTKSASFYRRINLEDSLYAGGNAGKLPETITASNYTTKFPTYSATTDDNGIATVNLTQIGLQDGVYVVIERNNPAIKAPVDPFYVVIPGTNEAGTDWVYEINVKPKNEIIGDIDIEKDVISLGNDFASVDAYKAHTWIIGTPIPVDITNGREYVISDTLDSRLDYLGNVKVYVEAVDPATEEEIAAQDARIVTIKGVSTGVIPVEFFDNEELVGEKVTKVTSVAGEKIVIYGLAYGAYYIVETKAPAGYNLLTGPLEITIDADSHEEEEAVVVENNKGAQLPETGGIGTTIYTTTGMTLIAFAAVMIVLRKREMEF